MLNKKEQINFKRSRNIEMWQKKDFSEWALLLNNRIM